MTRFIFISIFLIALLIGKSHAQVDTLHQSTNTTTQVDSANQLTDSASHQVVSTPTQKRDTIQAATKSLMPEKIRPKGSPEWLFWLMLVQLALIVFIRVQFGREFAEVFTVFVNNNLTQQLYREAQAGGLRMGYFMLNINFTLSLGTWAYLTLKYIGPNIGYSDLQVLPFAVGLVGILLMARFAALRLATSLLKSSKEIGLFNFTDLQLFRATGLLLFPVNAFLAYAPPQQRIYFLWFSLVVLVTFLLFRCLRGFEIGRTRLSANVFHFVVYICALEIAPVLIGIRFFLNTFGL